MGKFHKLRPNSRKLQDKKCFTCCIDTSRLNLCRMSNNGYSQRSFFDLGLKYLIIPF